MIGLVGSAATLGRLDQSSLSRDVVIDGERVAAIPGTIEFKVVEPLSDDLPSEMRVGVLTKAASSEPPQCVLRDDKDKQIPMDVVGGSGGYVSPNHRDMATYAVVVLKPGSYDISCREFGVDELDPTRDPRDSGQSASGQSAGSTPRGSREFSVGRVIGPTELTSGELRPLLWFGVVALVAGAVFLAGGVTLVVGLINRRSNQRAGQTNWPR